MPAAVNRIYICPKCDAPMSSKDKPKRCPQCEFRFNKEDEDLATELSWGKAPSRQLFEIIQQEMDKEIPESEREHKASAKEEIKTKVMITTKQKYDVIKSKWDVKKQQFFFNTEVDDIEEWVKCIHYLMNRCLSSGNHKLIKMCAVWSEEFANISKFLKPFIENGGQTYARADKAAESGDSADS